MTSWTSGQEKLSRTVGSSATFRSAIILVTWQIRTKTPQLTRILEARGRTTLLRMRRTKKRTKKTGMARKKLTRFLPQMALLLQKSPDSCHSGLRPAVQTGMTWRTSLKQRRSDANSMAETTLLKTNLTFCPHGLPPLGGPHLLPGPNLGDPRLQPQILNLKMSLLFRISVETRFITDIVLVGRPVRKFQIRWLHHHRPRLAQDSPLRFPFPSPRYCPARPSTPIGVLRSKSV